MILNAVKEIFTIKKYPVEHLFVLTTAWLLLGKLWIIVHRSALITVFTIHIHLLTLGSAWEIPL